MLNLIPCNRLQSMPSFQEYQHVSKCFPCTQENPKFCKYLWTFFLFKMQCPTNLLLLECLYILDQALSCTLSDTLCAGQFTSCNFFNASCACFNAPCGTLSCLYSMADIADRPRLTPTLLYLTPPKSCGMNIFPPASNLVQPRKQEHTVPDGARLTAAAAIKSPIVSSLTLIHLLRGGCSCVAVLSCSICNQHPVVNIKCKQTCEAQHSASSAQTCQGSSGLFHANHAQPTGGLKPSTAQPESISCLYHGASIRACSSTTPYA